MSYIILRGRWCNIIVLNVHAPCEDKGGDVKDSFYEELGRLFDQFPRYDMKILLGDFNAKAGRENISKPHNRQMHNGELHNLYSSPDIIRQIKSRRMRWAGHVARMGEGRNVYRVLMGKPEGKRPLERPRRR
jgi:hypothetical protein